MQKNKILNFTKKKKNNEIKILFSSNCELIKKYILSICYGKEIKINSDLHTHIFNYFYNKNEYRISILVDNPDNEIKFIPLKKKTENLIYSKDIYIITQIFKSDDLFSKYDFKKNIEIIEKIEKNNSKKYKVALVYVFGIFLPKKLEKEFDTGNLKNIDLIFTEESENLDLYEIENVELLALDYLELKKRKKNLEKNLIRINGVNDKHNGIECTLEEKKKLSMCHDYYDKYKKKMNKTVDIRFCNILIKKTKKGIDFSKNNKEFIEKIIKLNNGFLNLNLRKIKDVDYEIKTMEKEKNKTNGEKCEYCKLS